MLPSDFQYTITGRHRLFDLHLRETFQYRDLIYLFVKRDFISLYKQTILGPLWAIFQPLLTTIVFTIIFGHMAKLTTLDAPGDYVLPGFLFYMAGNCCWIFFSTIVNSTSNTFLENRGTMGKVYYPRLVAPIATACSKLLSFGIQLLLFFAFWCFFLLRGDTSIRPTPALLLLPLLTLQLMLLAIGCGILISSVTTKYRDLTHLVAFGLQLWQYGSPIAYGLSLVSEPMQKWYLLNPVVPILTAFRYALFGFGHFHSGYYALSWVSTLLVFFLGLILFSRIERTFMDTI